MKKITIMFCTLFVIAVLTLTNSTLIKADTIKENATVEFTCEHPLIDGSTDAEIASQRDFTKGYTCKLDLGNDFTSETDFYPAGTTIELSNAGSYIYTLESVTPGSTNLDESVATIDGNTITLNEDVVDSEGLGTSLSLGIKVNFADFQKEDFSVTKAKKNN